MPGVRVVSVVSGLLSLDSINHKMRKGEDMVFGDWAEACRMVPEFAGYKIRGHIQVQDIDKEPSLVPAIKLLSAPPKEVPKAENPDVARLMRQLQSHASLK